MQDKARGSSPQISHLRAEAETSLSGNPTGEQSPLQPDEVLHELHVHQIELQMQNETLRQAQVELDASRTRYATLYDFAPVGYLTLTDTCLISQINLTGLALLGAKPEELLQHRFDDFVAKKDVDRWRQWFTSFKKQSAMRSIEVEMQRADTGCFYARLDCRLLLDQGEAPVIYLTISDISERKLAEIALEKLKDQLENLVAARTAELVARKAQLSHVSRLTATLAAVNKSILHDGSLSEVYLAACRAFVKEGGYKLAWMGQIDASGKKIKIRHSYGRGLGFLDGLRVDTRPDSPFGNVPTAIAFRRQSPCICPDFDSDPATLPWREQARFYELRSVIALPIICDGVPWGVLTAYGEQSQVFDTAAERVLKEIAQTLSFAIRYFATETQKREAANALRESEALLQEAQKMASLGHWNYEVDTQRLSWSQQLYRLCERDPASGPVGLGDISACYVPESAKLLEQAIEQAMNAGERVELVLQAGFADGRIVHHALSIFPQRDTQGKTVKLYGTVQDITEHKLAEERLIRLAEQLAHSADEVADLYQNAPCGYHSLDKDGVFCQINDTELAWLGYTRTEIVGKKNITDLLSPATLPNFEAPFRQLQKSGLLRDLELEFVRKDGTILPVLISASALYDTTGQFVMCRATTYDMTERQKMEHERARYTRRLAELSRHLVAVQEAARRQLAGELHDRTSPNLAALDINFGILARSLPKAQFAELSERLEDTQALIRDTSASIRDICADLRPPVLDYAGLGAALETYAQQFSRRTGIVVHLHCTSQNRRLAPDIESLLFRIAQESLTNCAKHAKARSIQLTLDNAHSPVVLRITDDGAGFSPDEIGKEGSSCGLGILNMREMAEFAGGKLSIQSSPGQGTCLTVEIP